MKETLAVLSLVTSVASNIPFIYETVKGKAKPERVSWLLWTLLGATYYSSAVFEDGAVWLTFGELVGPIVIFLLSLKYGVGGKSRFDKYSLMVALVAFSLIFAVEGVLVGLLLALTVDTIGAVLTFRKTLIDPASESRAFWALGAVAAVLALSSLTNYSLENLLFPLYLFCLSAVMFSITNPSKEQNLKEMEDL